VTESSPAIPAPSHPNSPIPALIPESFWSILVRRSRYLIAIAVSAIIFSFVAWPFIAPPPAMAGVSLLAWSMSTGLIGALVIALLLIIVGTICTILVHPDAPHMGLFCALAGMAVLSIRGGNSHMLIQYGQMTNTWSNRSILLAVECVQWAILIVVVETVVRLAHDRFFANTHWMLRTGVEAAHQHATDWSEGNAKPMGVSLTVSQALGTKNLNRLLSAPLGMLYSGIVAYLLLYATLQSQQKDQVLFACFIAFFFSTGNAYLAFPRASVLAFALAAPLTAAVGYYLGSTHPAFIYPGQGGYFISRALPIDFIVAGIPGAILGYYAAFRWSLTSHEPKA
jgi:hypothetical protein